MALGDRKKARDEFFERLESLLVEIADNSTTTIPPTVTLHSTT